MHLDLSIMDLRRLQLSYLLNSRRFALVLRMQIQLDAEAYTGGVIPAYKYNFVY